MYPEGPFYLFRNAFKLLNFPDPDMQPVRIIAGIFIWLPNFTVLFVLLSRVVNIKKWLLSLLMLLSLVPGGFVIYETQTDFNMIGWAPTVGSAFWVWYTSLLFLFTSQVFFWFKR